MAKKKDKTPKKPKPINPIYDPLSQLKGKTLRKAVRAITNLQYQPQIAALNEQIASLGRQQASTTENLAKQGTQAQTNVSGFYQQIAREEAANLARQRQLAEQAQAQSGQVAAQTGQTIAQAGQTASGQLNESAARNELQAMVAEQQARQAREGQALQGGLTSQNENWLALKAAMDASTQARGGTNLSQLARQNLSDISQANAGFNEQIARAMADRAGLKGQAANAFIDNLMKARGGEREFDLGLKALKSKSDYNSLQRWLAKFRAKEDAKTRAAQFALADIYGQQKREGWATQMEIAQLQSDPSTERWREAYRKIRSDLGAKIPGAKGKKVTPGYILSHRQKTIDTLVGKFNFTEAEAIKAFQQFKKKNKPPAGESYSGGLRT